MAEFLETIERVQQENADVQKLFGGEGRGVHGLRESATHMSKVAALAGLMADVVKGRKRASLLQEAMTTSDFPYLFGDILDRQLYASYAEAPATWRAFTKVSTVNDFRSVRRIRVTGAEGQLAEVKEQAEYPLAALDEERYTYSVKKFGRRMAFSWEAIINDDLGALQDIPNRMGKAARRTESRFVSDLYLDANGPDATFYSSGHANIVTSNPTLTIGGLQTAFTVLAAQRDADNEPIVLDMVKLVVPPALEVTARNILNGTQLFVGSTGDNQLITANWMQSRVQLVVDPYIPVIVTTGSVGNTMWALFADPNQGPPAIEVGFLRGHETPEVFVKAPNATKVGGGVDPLNGDFDTDSVEYKLRHVMGGTMVDYRVSVASKGTGS
jgi:hypothetical protein